MKDFVAPRDRDYLREKWRLAALEHVKLEDVASRMEEGRTSFLARLTLDLVTNEGLAMTRAEKQARVMKVYVDYVSAMHDARRAANEARVERDNADRLYWQAATVEANQRAEMRMR